MVPALAAVVVNSPSGSPEREKPLRNFAGSMVKTSRLLSDRVKREGHLTLSSNG